MQHTPTFPRPEHPKPQFMRPQWINLNGAWNFAFDFGRSGVERKWYQRDRPFDREIMVPFCPESKLSGLEYKDFMPGVWYQRAFEVPPDWQGQRIFLHFGGVEYDCRAWVNGIPVGRHYGGSVSFSFEITTALRAGLNQLVVYAEDDIRAKNQPAGKQSPTYYNAGCCKYTRVTGIWQTVWLEARPHSYLESVAIVPDLDNARFLLTPVCQNVRRGQTFHAVLLNADNQPVATTQGAAQSGITFTLDIPQPRAWSPADPYLYTLMLELRDGDQAIDRVQSYAGLRKIHLEGNTIYLNNQPIYLRFVLDQGFYPDGVWTAPSDAELKADIERSLAVGFNGARLHEKVFEERFHYWADTLGYLTWGEFPDWNVHDYSYLNVEGMHNIQREWREVVLRDRNHPSLIAWTPLNESGWAAKTDLEAYRRGVAEIYDLTRALDPTRPVNDVSGWVHIKTDLFTVHDYTQNSEKLRERYAQIAPDKPEDAYMMDWKWFGDIKDYHEKYAGQPYLVDEYGGTFWLPAYETARTGEGFLDDGAAPADFGQSRNTWGFGKNTRQVEDLIEALTLPLLANPNVVGFTYTQLTDVEQEVNGVYTYDRQLKFNAERLKAIFGAPSAVEQQRE